MTSTLRALALLALVSSVGCACGRRLELRPLHASPGVPLRLATVSHDLRVGDRAVGELTVWAEPLKRDAEGTPHVHLGLKIRNDDKEQAIILVVSSTALEVYSRGGGTRVLRNPKVRGPTSVPAGQTRRFGVFYRLPSACEPASVVGAELNWTLETGAGKITRSTQFVRSLERYYYDRYPYDYHYDPYDPWRSDSYWYDPYPWGYWNTPWRYRYW